MNSPIQIWTCAAFLPAYGCGGWAYVRSVGGPLTGAAGGERKTTASRLALAGLATALRDLPEQTALIHVHTSSPELAQFAQVLRSLDKPAEATPPEDDVDLWALILKALAGRRLTLNRTAPRPGAPTAFATAWAELARDKAKASGAFSSVIPRANLAKLQGAALG